MKFTLLSLHGMKVFACSAGVLQNEQGSDVTMKRYAIADSARNSLLVQYERNVVVHAEYDGSEEGPVGFMCMG